MAQNTLYAFNRWANDKALAIAESLTAEQLDRPFEMGLGSIRNRSPLLLIRRRVHPLRRDPKILPTLP